MGKTESRGDQFAAKEIAPFLEPLTALQKVLEHFDNKGVIIGGIAASLLGKPRLTAYLDAVILLSVDDLPELIEASREQDINPRISDADSFARKNRILLLQHQASGINIDISLVILPFETEMVSRSQKLTIGSLEIRVPTPEDLIILKAIAHRPQDLSDIQAIAVSHPELDKERIRFWVEEFGAVLDFPDFWERISRLI